jgi:predicted dehydrogenase
MTSIAIVGGGRAATLHAEAARAAPGADLVGVGGRSPGTATALAAAMGVDDLPLDDLIARADGLVVAVPPDAVGGVLDRIPTGLPLLVETPVPAGPAHSASPTAMVATNLLHAATVTRGLRAIGELGDVHHLVLRGRAVPRPHARDLVAEPFAGAWAVLLAAAGTAAASVRATRLDDRVSTRVTLDDGRTVRAELEWVAPGTPSTITEIEAAGATGVVSLGLWPVPSLEIDGRAVSPADEPPLVALGFVEQMRRFAAVCTGRTSAWPPLTVGVGIDALCRAAARSAAQGGAPEAL